MKPTAGEDRPNRSGQAEPQCIQERVSVNLALSRIANLLAPPLAPLAVRIFSNLAF